MRFILFTFATKHTKHTMGTIPNFKTGNCECGCGGVGVQGRKVGKIFYCLGSYTAMKRKQYGSKINQNNKVRALGAKQVQFGNYDAASMQQLKNDLDYCFSRIVKMTAADEFGIVTCYTCPNVDHWSMPSMQCGHFISRKETQLRWDFRNARVQCKKCNEILSGNMEVYTKRLEAEHKGLPDQLREMSIEPHKWGISELKQLLTDLRAKLRIIETKFK